MPEIPEGFYNTKGYFHTETERKELTSTSPEVFEAMRKALASYLEAVSEEQSDTAPTDTIPSEDI